jgi:guanylate kinase
MAHAAAYDYVIINDNLSEALQDFASIVRAERLRTPRQVSRHGSLFNPSK